MQAYDLKELGERLKGIGLELAEENLKVLVPEILKFLKDSAEASETPYDDVLVALLPVLETFILEQVEKINGED